MAEPRDKTTSAKGEYAKKQSAIERLEEAIEKRKRVILGIAAAVVLVAIVVVAVVVF